MPKKMLHFVYFQIFINFYELNYNFYEFLRNYYKNLGTRNILNFGRLDTSSRSKLIGLPQWGYPPLGKDDDVHISEREWSEEFGKLFFEIIKKIKSFIFTLKTLFMHWF